MKGNSRGKNAETGGAYLPPVCYCLRSYQLLAAGELLCVTFASFGRVGSRSCFKSFGEFDWLGVSSFPSLPVVAEWSVLWLADKNSKYAALEL